MDWVPFVLITVKLAVFIPGMFFAIKWHYDQGKKRKKNGLRGFLAEIERTPDASDPSPISRRHDTDQAPAPTRS